MSEPRDGFPPLTLVLGGLTADAPPIGDGQPTRRCGRCLAQFPADPDAEPIVIQEFWMCPTCREALLGKSNRREH